MNLLLDTHILIWWLEGSNRLHKKTKNAILSADTCYVSAASLWEMAIKVSLQRLELNIDLEDLPIEVKRCGFQVLSINSTHVIKTATLPHHHNDPFDRLLISQAISEPLTLVTSDHHILQYQNVTIINNSN